MSDVDKALKSFSDLLKEVESYDKNTTIELKGARAPTKSFPISSFLKEMAHDLNKTMALQYSRGSGSNSVVVIDAPKLIQPLVRAYQEDMIAFGGGYFAQPAKIKLKAVHPLLENWLASNGGSAPFKLPAYYGMVFCFNSLLGRLLKPIGVSKFWPYSVRPNIMVLSQIDECAAILSLGNIYINETKGVIEYSWGFQGSLLENMKNYLASISSYCFKSELESLKKHNGIDLLNSGNLGLLALISSIDRDIAGIWSTVGSLASSISSENHLTVRVSPRISLDADPTAAFYQTYAFDTLSFSLKKFESV